MKCSLATLKKAAPWSSASIRGCKRFLERIWGLQDQVLPQEEYRPALESSFHKTIAKVSNDIEQLKFNTAIAAMMSLLNEITAAGGITKGELKTLLLLLNPFAPHITEEIWQQQNFGGQIAHHSWPTYDPAKCVEDTVEIAVQVNGKIKCRLQVPADASKEQLLDLAKAEEKVAQAMEGKNHCEGNCRAEKTGEHCSQVNRRRKRPCRMKNTAGLFGCASGGGRRTKRIGRCERGLAGSVLCWKKNFLFASTCMETAKTP